MMKSLKLFVTKAAEDCRTPKPGGGRQALSAIPLQASQERAAMSRERRGVRQSPAAFPSRTERGLTLVEVLIVILVVFILLCLVWPFGETRTKQRVLRIKCVSNLKQVGLAFRVWSGDQTARFPMAVYTNKLGRPLYEDSADLFRYFQVMSNELSNPVILTCPADDRVAATNFTTDINNNHISFFVGLDANENDFNSFLAGDSNITNGFADKNGLLELTTNQTIGWTSERHNEQGNVALADGSVQQFSSSALKKALQKTGLATNLLLMPDKNSVK